jgi:putative transposase
MKVRRGLPSLRQRPVFLVVRRVLAAESERFGFRIVHFSVQADHIHLLVEADDRCASSRGMQRLAARLAKALNRQLQRKGSVFADRYHARTLKTPREVRWALRYVLLNARKHQSQPGHDRRGAVPNGCVDPCSSAAWFSGFSRAAEVMDCTEECRVDFEQRWGPDAVPIAPAQSWLLRVGYARAGPFDIDETPG